MPESLDLVAGGASETITVTVAPIDATNKKVIWASNNEDVATVIDGQVKAISKGEAEISATTDDGVFTAVCNVKVTSYFDNGRGTEADPFLISSAKDLNNVRHFLDLDVYFKQTEDIDLSEYSTGKGWEPIGAQPHKERFKGTYDGDNHMISKLTINRPEESNQGLFGHIDEAVLKNIKLKDVNVKGGDNHTGGLVGFSSASFEDKSVIEGCMVSGYVEGKANVGGLVEAMSVGDVYKSFSECIVKGFRDVGGLVGKSADHTAITSSYYDSETTGQSDDTGKGEPKTTAEMKQAATFEGWDKIGRASCRERV